MPHKRSIKAKHRNCNNPPMEAQHMIQLLETLSGELDNFENLLALSVMLLDRYYVRHKQVHLLVNRVKRSTVRLTGEAEVLKRKYKKFLEDYEHQYGHEDYPSFQSMLNYSISLGDLLEHFSEDVIVEDFLDG